MKIDGAEGEGGMNKAEERWREHKGWAISEDQIAMDTVEKEWLRLRRDHAQAMTLGDLRKRRERQLVRRGVIIGLAIAATLGLIWTSARSEDRRQCRQDPTCHIYGNPKGNEGSTP